MTATNFTRRAAHLFGTAIRESGQALDRLGLMITGNDIYKEVFSRHRPIMKIYDKNPILAVDTFVAPNASIIGKVLTHDKSSVWYGAILRADKSKIKLGFCSNIQDRAVITCTDDLESVHSSDVEIGNYVTIGQGTTLSSCIVQDETHIGMNAVVQEGSIIESKVIVAAGSVVPPGTLIPTGQYWAGNPAVHVRNLSDHEILGLQKMAEEYSRLAHQHRDEFLPYGTLHQQAESNTW